MRAGLVVRLGKVFCCLGERESIRISASVREIGDEAFSGKTSLRGLSFEEGTLRIGVFAFAECCNLRKAAFPASLISIEACAGSQLQYIRSEAFSECHQLKIVIPAGIREIDPFAFSSYHWGYSNSVKFEGGRPMLSIVTAFVLAIRV
jgi:hypothetical protein